jgi:hypothetical protein
MPVANFVLRVRQVRELTKLLPASSSQLTQAHRHGVIRYPKTERYCRLCSEITRQVTNNMFIYQMKHCQYHLKTQCFRLSQNRTLLYQ